MKKTLTVLLLCLMCLSLSGCDISRFGTDVKDSMVDLKAEAASAERVTVKSRKDKFTFKVKVDKDTVFGDDLYYDWYIYMKDGDSWADYAFLLTKNPNTQHNNKPTINQDVYAASNGNTGELIKFIQIAGPGEYKFSCYVKNPVEGDEATDRKSYVIIDFYVTVTEGVGEPNF